jgi:hypothetical protein
MTFIYLPFSLGDYAEKITALFGYDKVLPMNTGKTQFTPIIVALLLLSEMI